MRAFFQRLDSCYEFVLPRPMSISRNYFLQISSAVNCTKWLLYPRHIEIVSSHQKVWLSQCHSWWQLASSWRPWHPCRRRHSFAIWVPLTDSASHLIEECKGSFVWRLQHSKRLIWSAYGLLLIVTVYHHNWWRRWTSASHAHSTDYSCSSYVTVWFHIHPLWSCE